MRSPQEEFREFCPLAPEEITALATPVYVLDTNVLLHLYRYSETARVQFLEFLRLVRKQLFIPYQVALEFHRNRAEVIAEQLAIADKTVAALDAEIKNLDVALDSVLTHKYHPYIDRSEVLSGLKDALVKSRDAVADGSQRYHADFGADPVLAAIHEVIEGHIGEPFSRDELTEVYKEAEDRYARQVPPGYKDIKKPVPDRYGDLVLWKETLRYGAAHNCPAIIVTDDNKEDWIWRTHGRTISIRPEMRREYYDAASQPVWLYTPERFMLETSKSLGQTVQPDILTEISEQTEDARLRAELSEAVAEIAAQSSAAAVGFDTAKHVEEPEPVRARSSERTGWPDTPTYAESVHKALRPNILDKIRTSAPPFASEAVRRALGLDFLEKIGASSVLFDSEAMGRLLGLDALRASSVLFDSEAMGRLLGLDALRASSVLFDSEATRRLLGLDALRASSVLFDADATLRALGHGTLPARAMASLRPRAEGPESRVEEAKRNSEMPPSNQPVPAESESGAGGSTDPSEAGHLSDARHEGENTEDSESPNNTQDPSSEQ